MIPILFDENSTEFKSNGIGRLSDCIKCEVTEERNGIFEVEFTYPITGKFYSEIKELRIILVDHDERKDAQPFEIYRRSAPINGIVTFNARHITYKLSNVIVSPFTASSITDAFESFRTQSMTENNFTFWTDKTSPGSFSIGVPTSIRAALGGTQGSILDAFGGGEYEFDNYVVKLHQHRGRDNGVTIRYGKNLADIENEVDVGSVYSAVVPYWSDGEATVVYGGVVAGDSGIVYTADWTDETGAPIQDENGEHITFNYSRRIVVPMDLSSEFEDAPTVAQLEAKAQTILNNNQPWVPRVSIDVDFVQLWQTEEYKNVAPLERVQLCDTVTVYYEALGVNATAKVIKVVWNALTERYDKMELGDAKTSFVETIMAETEQIMSEYPSYSAMDLAIANATELITGGMGGHIVFLYDADGKPTDMLVMDTEDVATAVHVLRINVNGIGFSSNGVSGPFTSAWTLDGAFVADFITTGTMSAARIHGGTLVLGGSNNGNGSIIVYDASGNVIGRWNNAGIEINGGTIRTTDGTRTATIDSGYTKYYSGQYTSGNYIYIGDVGVRTDFNASDDRGLSFGLANDGDYMGWFLSQNSGNTSYEPVLIYSKDSYLTKDIWGDALTALRDFHVSDGYAIKNSDIKSCDISSGTIDNTTMTNSVITGSTFEGGITDPYWNLDGGYYAGITKSTQTFGLVHLNSSGGVAGYWSCSMTFRHGILVSATLP